MVFATTAFLCLGYKLFLMYNLCNLKTSRKLKTVFSSRSAEFPTLFKLNNIFYNIVFKSPSFIVLTRYSFRFKHLIYCKSLNVRIDLIHT